MNGRSAPWVVRILLAVTAVAALTLGPLSTSAAAHGPLGPGLREPPTATHPTPAVELPAAAPTPPGSDGTEANPFLPDQRDLTDCVGLVERPGCGNESRGGLHQGLVALVMTAGLLVVFGRIAWSIRRGQQRQQSVDRS